jgi:hypothetical protein
MDNMKITYKKHLQVPTHLQFGMTIRHIYPTNILIFSSTDPILLFLVTYNQSVNENSCIKK